MPMFEKATCEPSSGFSWLKARQDLDGLPGTGSINIAHEAVDRHVLNGRGHHVAVRWLRRDQVERDLHYADLMRLSNRFANVLQTLGIGPGARVASLAGRIPALYATAFGALKNRSVFCPLSTVFDTGAIKQRLVLGSVALLVVPLDLYEEKIRELRPELPALKHVIVVSDPLHPCPPAGVHDWLYLIENASEHFSVPRTVGTDPAFLHFTCGGAGGVEGIVHAHDAGIVHREVGRFAFDLRERDIFWSSTDPGTGTSTFDGVLAPLINGATLLADEVEFDAKRCAHILRREGVNVWHTAPEEFHSLIAAGNRLPSATDLPQLRLVSCAGGHINREAELASQDVLGRPLHGSWSQTETGGIIIANCAGVEVRPGSSGRPLPGIECAIVARGAGGSIEPMPDGEFGELAVRAGWPSMFQSYLAAPERYVARFADGWYMSGEVARRDDDGTYWVR